MMTMAEPQLKLVRSYQIPDVLAKRYGICVSNMTVWRWRQIVPLRLPCTETQLCGWFELYLESRNKI